MSIEFGSYRPEAEKPKIDSGKKISDISDNWQSKLEHIASNPELSRLFTTSIKVAEAKFLEDKDVLGRFKNLFSELEQDDEEFANKQAIEDFIDAEAPEDEDIDDEDDDYGDDDEADENY